MIPRYAYAVFICVVGRRYWLFERVCYHKNAAAALMANRPKGSYKIVKYKKVDA